LDESKRDLDIPLSIKEWGIDKNEFLAKVDQLAVNAFDDQCTGANPRYPLFSELRNILLDSQYGRPSVEEYERGGMTQSESCNSFTVLTAAGQTEE